MQVTVIGTGYVGLVTGVCLADTAGNVVAGYDTNAETIARLTDGVPTIHEGGLPELLSRNLAAGRLWFTTDVCRAVRHGEVLFVAVGTPSLEDGEPDTRSIKKVVEDIAPHIDRPKVVALKSTVPPGTSDEIEQMFHKLGCADRVKLVSNPEFLREGSAVHDFQHPDRVVIGTTDADAAAKIRDLHRPFASEDKMLMMPRGEAELTKYAANAYLAMRISFINQIARLCEHARIDVDHVIKGIGADPRIGSGFLAPGIGYGGSCFPKDVKGLISIARRLGAPAELAEATDAVNTRQRNRLLDFLDDRFGKDLHGRTIAVWGCSFKPNTNDLREAPALVTIRGLLDRGAAVRAHDPKALPEVDRIFRDAITCCGDAWEALAGAEALVICTEWPEFCKADLERVKAALRQPIVFDGRNVYNTDRMRRLGFEYYSIGRPPVRPDNTRT